MSKAAISRTGPTSPARASSIVPVRPRACSIRAPAARSSPASATGCEASTSAFSCEPGNRELSMNRREFTGAVSVGIAAAGTPGTAVFAQGPGSQPDTAQRSEPRLVVAALVHDKMILLDLAGPLTVFNLLRAEVYLVGKSLTPVKTDVGIAIAPTTMLADCPANVDILFVPGGLEGTVAMMGDPEVVAFLADRGSRARYVTSVCTGSLLLGAAGLLRGYQATSHWYVRDLLGLMGASVRGDRVVVDRNRLTGGGVTAGVDFGLEIAR